MLRKRRIPIDDGNDDAPDQEPEADAEDLPVETAGGRLERLESELAAREAELKEARDDHLRAVADLQNFRRRAREERQDAIRYGRETVLETVLPVLDNFERALSAARESRESDALIEGVELIQRQLHDILAKHDVRPIEAVGQPFDPHLHDAVGRVETSEQPEGTVVAEELKGYTMGDTVLRHSRVLVAAPPAQPQDTEE